MSGADNAGVSIRDLVYRDLAGTMGVYDRLEAEGGRTWVFEETEYIFWEMAKDGEIDDGNSTEEIVKAISARVLEGLGQLEKDRSTGAIDPNAECIGRDSHRIPRINCVFIEGDAWWEMLREAALDVLAGSVRSSSERFPEGHDVCITLNGSVDLDEERAGVDPVVRTRPPGAGATWKDAGTIRLHQFALQVKDG